MSVYLTFSDECGDYEITMGKKQLNAHPYYARNAIIINAEEWNFLNNQFKKIKLKYSNISKSFLSHEFKWSYIWQIRRCQKNNLEINEVKDYKPFAAIDYKDLMKYVSEILSLLNYLSEIKIIFTIAQNNNSVGFSKKGFLKIHLENLLERVQFEMQNIKSANIQNDEPLSILFFDKLSDKLLNKYLSDSYQNLINDGRFINDYKYVMDVLNQQDSYQSIGLQLADYVIGCFNGFLKDYNYSTELFFDTIYEKICRKENPRYPIGYGIKVTPKNEIFEQELSNKIRNEFKKYNDKKV